MIKFKCDLKQLKSKELIQKMDYHQQLATECYFCITIDGDLFFEEPLFPIYEFLFFYYKWDRKTDFEYITIESEDNPLISFCKTNMGWQIKSKWEIKKCERLFTISEIIGAIEKISEAE